MLVGLCRTMRLLALQAFNGGTYEEMKGFLVPACNAPRPASDEEEPPDTESGNLARA